MEPEPLPDWIGIHVVRAHTFFGEVPEILVSNDLKSGIIRICRYKPGANPIYAEMIHYYGVAVIPAHVLKTQTKALTEASMHGYSVALGPSWV